MGVEGGEKGIGVGEGWGRGTGEGGVVRLEGGWQCARQDRCLGEGKGNVDERVDR